MNLIIVTALIAVCGAAKLDRTYLPPLSAASAGGSPGSLQAPLTRSSVQETEPPRLPSGGYTNEFGGVVVDAASPGTRASVDADQSNLGGPRQSYGSTDSKVGDAAFRGTAGFRDTSFGSKGQIDTGSLSNSQNSAENSQFPSQNRNGQFSSLNRNGQFSDGQVSNIENKSERPQAAKDRNSNILALSNDVDSDRYSYGFETDNGIAVGENGVAVNGIQAEGGYSYQGDDGQVYKVTYTADEGGYRPQGAHLPTPPPIPEEILKSLEKNAKEEAAGLVDDGSYDAQKYNTEGDYMNDNGGNIQHNGGQLSLFGKRPESDATASGSFINQNGQAFRQPGLGQISSAEQYSHFTSQSSQSNGGSGQFGTAGTQNSNSAFNGQTSQINENYSSGQFSSQSAFDAESTQSNKKPGLFGVSGTQYNDQLSQVNRQQFLNGQTYQGNKPQNDDASSSAHYSGTNQNIQIPGNHMPPTSSQGQSSFGGFNHFGSHASSSAQVQNQSPNFESAPQGLNTQLSSETRPSISQPSDISQAQPQFGSSFKPQGSEAFSGASLDHEQDGQDFGKPFPQTFSGQNFNRPNTPTGQVQAHKFLSGINNFNKQSSSQNGGKNEYLPPNAGQQPEQIQVSNVLNSNTSSLGSLTAGPNFNSQISANNKPMPNFTPLNRQKPNLASASASTSFQQSGFQSQPARPFNSFNSQAVASQPKPYQFTQQSSRFGQQNKQQTSQSYSKNPQFNANIQQSSIFSQTHQEQPLSTVNSFGTKPTSIPNIELTTPLETPSYSLDSQIASQKIPNFNTIDPKLPSNTQTQAQFGFQTFGQQTIQSLSPNFPTSTPSALQSVSSVGNNPNKSFSKVQLSQNSFGQKQSSSNQGSDSSYYYDQPSQPFGLMANRPQPPSFPSSSSYQSNSIASQNINQQNSFSGKFPFSQSSAPVAPTTPSQFNQQQNYNGITQASISSFPSPPTSTPSQLGSAQNNQFESNPTFNQQSFGNQAYQASKPTPEKQPTFGSQFQKTGSQQSKPTFAQGQSGFLFQPVSQFGQTSSSGFGTQNKFGHSEQFEQSQNKPGFSVQSSDDKPTVTQQYQGTIYEYNKPALVLPAPTQTDSTSSQSIQSGVAVETKSSVDQQGNLQNQVNKLGSKPFESSKFGQISQIQQFNKFSSQTAPTNNQFSNAQSNQFDSGTQQQNVQGSQQPFKPFGFSGQSSFGSKPQLGSPNNEFIQNSQTILNSQTSQPAPSSSQSQFGSSTFGNAAFSQHNGYFYPNPTSQFPENFQSIRPQSTLNQNNQTPISQSLFSSSQQTAQSQINPNSAAKFSTQSSQTGQTDAQNTPIQPFGQSTASSQAVASGQATASASATLQEPQNKPFRLQDKNQFGLNNDNVQGQTIQQLEVQNLQTVGNSQYGDSLKPYGALNSHSGASTSEFSKQVFSSACCQASKDSTPAQSADVPSHSDFQGTQNFNTQSFAGKGEEFGGPRQPPKFDETGYHY